MQKWKWAVNKFLEHWEEDESVIGALVCGSYVTGSPSPHSDIDVHILLKAGTNWRERGNLIIENYLIEYFINPPEQIRSYFLEDYEDRRSHAAVQFATGEILFDRFGTVEQLRQEGESWLKKEYKIMNSTAIELMKYSIWDTLDNLQDAYEKGSQDYHFVYSHSLSDLFNAYCHFLNIETIPPYQVKPYLSEQNFLTKYRKSAFPDEFFSRKFQRALKLSHRDEMMAIYHQLAEYVLLKMGDFQINGWKMRSPINLRENT
ncbi:putative nucleotidyltransferase [Bacillus pakistanensis]|uniref:Nucleotidyltransferase n=1 Tax=Rossellomorea pakistanensis TaxID=992288 RepID=A0ABS2N8M7_9BACI|nr:nucleotidyltransferase domain-containing protein [Bacillus pakistanensis]MBM7584104.1 putative nucleotidyltransferase [Bacillus pakistanensis]